MEEYLYQHSRKSIQDAIKDAIMDASNQASNHQDTLVKICLDLPKGSFLIS